MRFPDFAVDGFVALSVVVAVCTLITTVAALLFWTWWIASMSGTPALVARRHARTTTIAAIWGWAALVSCLIAAFAVDSFVLH